MTVRIQRRMDTTTGLSKEHSKLHQTTGIFWRMGFQCLGKHLRWMFWQHGLGYFSFNGRQKIFLIDYFALPPLRTSRPLLLYSLLRSWIQAQWPETTWNLEICLGYKILFWPLSESWYFMVAILNHLPLHGWYLRRFFVPFPGGSRWHVPQRGQSTVNLQSIC